MPAAVLRRHFPPVRHPDETFVVTHLTHVRNVSSILKRGILTAYSADRHRIYCVNGEAARWALDHVAEHQGWDAREMCGIVFPITLDELRAMPRSGAYWIVRDVPASECVPLSLWSLGLSIQE
jgi:hypothetical protein